MSEQSRRTFLGAAAAVAAIPLPSSAAESEDRVAAAQDAESFDEWGYFTAEFEVEEPSLEAVTYSGDGSEPETYGLRCVVGAHVDAELREQTARELVATLHAAARETEHRTWSMSVASIWSAGVLPDAEAGESRRGRVAVDSFGSEDDVDVAIELRSTAGLTVTLGLSETRAIELAEELEAEVDWGAGR